jgi:REP element-mobilizing transposase RayT
VTRRCTQRQLLLRPSRRTNAILRYVLAIASKRFDVQVHAFCILSNHMHIVATDCDARLPQFVQYVSSLVARAVNASLGRWESLWAPSSYSAVRLESPEDIVAKTAYVLANPVSAGLVPCARDWPGLWSAPERIGGPPIDAPRPSVFFSADGAMPDRAAITLVHPPGFDSADEFRRRVVDALAAAEQAARHVASRVRGFLGVARVLAQSPFSRPTAREERRGLNPRVAAADKWKRVEALTRLRAFVERYRVALREHRAGRRDAFFPAGTYLMRVAHGVACATG